MSVFNLKEFDEDSMWIPDWESGHYEFRWYGLGERVVMPIKHRLRMAWYLLRYGQISKPRTQKAKVSSEVKP